MCYRTGEGNHDCSLVLISSVEATANCYWRCTVHQCTVVQVLENAFNTSAANSSVWNAIVANCEGALVSTSHFDTREHDPSLHRLAALLLLGDVVHFNCNAHCVTVVHCAAEVNISPKISISAQPLKMALHRNPAMHGSRMVIFLHDSKKALF